MLLCLLTGLHWPSIILCQVHRAAAKPYSDTSAKNTILDIMSGYFPIVLKQEFPDGVPLKVQHGTPLDATSIACQLP